MNIAIIPARGGSKRISRKNIKEFCGKPMIAYAISVAQESGLFQHIIVSTDDDEIAEIAKYWGAEIPFMRPSGLANDYVATAPVMVHAIEKIRALGWKFDYVCCIYPCAPFIQASDLCAAFKLIESSELDYCFPIALYPSAIQRALKLSSDRKIDSYYPEFESKRTQELENSYYDAGQFYWGKVKAWLKNPKIHSNSLGYVIPNWRAIDIDNLEDWKRAELLYNILLNEKIIMEIKK